MSLGYTESPAIGSINYCDITCLVVQDMKLPAFWVQTD